LGIGTIAPWAHRYSMVDLRKSAGNHIDPEMCSINLAIALNGRRAGVLHTPREREQGDIGVRLRESERSSVERSISGY
jgi:hypothetical protein